MLFRGGLKRSSCALLTPARMMDPDESASMARIFVSCFADTVRLVTVPPGRATAGRVSDDDDGDDYRDIRCDEPVLGPETRRGWKSQNPETRIVVVKYLQLCSLPFER